MKAIKYFTCIVLLALTSRIYSQIPDTIWTKTFGGPLADVGISVKQTNDGGFIVAGTTSSFGAGGQDIWLIKTDENGNTLWTKTFGGTGNDRAANVVHTNDNGYAVFGTTNSYGNGGDDFLLWKADSLGNTEWFKTYGGSFNEICTDGKQTIDRGYIIAGYFYNQVYRSIVIKVDDLGNEIWNKTLKVSNYSDLWANSVEQAINDNYFIGCTWGHDYFGGYAYEWYMFQLSEDGDSLFSTYYFNVGADFLTKIRNTTDGNLILGGSTAYEYIWLRKRNPNGGTIWSRIISVSVADVSLSDIEPTPDNGYIISAIVQVSNNSPLRDIVLLKTDADGFVEWEKRIIGNGIEDALSAYPTNDDGFVLSGKTNSVGAGDFDVWLLKFNYTPSLEITVISPNGGEHWMMWDTVQVEWSATGIDSVKIELSLSEGIEWITLAESVPNTGTFDWYVQAPSTSWYCLMKISNASDSTIFDISDTTFTIDMFPSVEDSSGLFASEFALLQNFPNPFNPSTVISYQLPVSGIVTLKVYDILGNEIATLVNEEKQPGTYEVEFDVTSHSGEVRNLSSGIYFYQLRSGNFIQTKKMVLMK
jgi:hypothetical protein